MIHRDLTWRLRGAVALLVVMTSAARAHDMNDDGTPAHAGAVQPKYMVMNFAANINEAPAIASVFDRFAPRVKVRWDERFLYIESDGMPDHNMMVGITNWQQQVPLPQPYTGNNAWQIPLQPVPAKKPASIKGRFLRGAIAIAVNGIPIFNPQNNRGEVSAEIGELDQWGGHCGRADDYHYHAAPLHLQKIVGIDRPIAFALDGYPIYGLTEPDGSPLGKLDEFNGHTDAQGNYHYHASTKYPYLNGGFHGEVIERGGQVDPQPRAFPVRPDTRPLRGAKIVDFVIVKPNSYSLSYTVGNSQYKINYSIDAGGTSRFEFVDGSGKSTTQTYQRRGNGGGGGDRGPQDAPPPPPTPPGSPGGAGQGGELHLIPRASAERLNLTEAQQRKIAELTARVRSQLDDILTPEQRKLLQESGPPRNSGGPPNDAPPPADQPQGSQPKSVAADIRKPVAGFVLRSPDVANGAALPKDYTGDGAGISPPLEWAGAPSGTQSFALVMHHIDPGGNAKWYWVVYDIPASAKSLPKNAGEVGTLGNNSINGRVGYAPPHSKGPGVKTYVLTLYALSDRPQVKVPASEVSRDVILNAIREHVTGTAEVRVTYERGAFGGQGK